jgi:hypothetical protein
MNKRIIKNDFNNPTPNQNYRITNPNPVPNPLCLSKYYLDKNKITSYNINCQPDNKKYIYTPPIGILSEDLLKIYQIESIDSLNDWIDDNIGSNILTINRIINAWIKVNYNTLKHNNNVLETIYIKLFHKYILVTDTNIINIQKETKDYIDYWINKHNKNEFDLNLFDDYKKYIIKKLKSNS